MNINKNDMAVLGTGPQHDVWSKTGVAWGVLGNSVRENTTIENIERLFKAGRQTDSRSSSSSCLWSSC
jgi:hypothetical protein